MSLLEETATRFLTVLSSEVEWLKLNDVNGVAHDEIGLYKKSMDRGCRGPSRCGNSGMYCQPHNGAGAMQAFSHFGHVEVGVGGYGFRDQSHTGQVQAEAQAWQYM